MIVAIGLRREDVYIANVVKCRPPENRDPMADEVATCSPFLFRQIEAIRPRVIVALGSPAARTLLGTQDRDHEAPRHLAELPRHPRDAHVPSGLPPARLHQGEPPARLVRPAGRRAIAWTRRRERPGGSPLFASVAVPVPTRRLFTYLVDPSMAAGVRVGARVRVPFAGRRVVGTVVAFPGDPPGEGIEARFVDAVLDGAAAPAPAVLALTRFVSDYYLCSWGEAIETALPPDAPPPAAKRFAARLPGADPDLLPARAKAQRRVLASLPQDGARVALHGLRDADRTILNVLAGRGLVEIVTERQEPPAGAPPVVAIEAGPAPNAAQTAVLGRLLPAVERDAYAPFLLYGATGSGKTEVYLRAAAAALAARTRGALPRAGDRPDAAARVAPRAPVPRRRSRCCTAGSAARERRDAWERVRSGSHAFRRSGRARRSSPRCATSAWSSSTRSRTDPTSSRTPRGTTPATWPSSVPRKRARRSCSARRRRRSSRSTTRGTGATRSSRCGGPRRGSGRCPTVRVVDMREEFREGGARGAALAGPRRRASRLPRSPRAGARPAEPPRVGRRRSCVPPAARARAARAAASR